MTPIRWSPQAVRDVEAIRDYIAQDSQRYAQLTVDRIIASLERLRLSPSRVGWCQNARIQRSERSSWGPFASSTGFGLASSASPRCFEGPGCSRPSSRRRPNRGLERTRPASNGMTGPCRSIQCCKGHRASVPYLRSAVIAYFLVCAAACAPAAHSEKEMPEVAIPQTSLCAPARAVLPIAADDCCETREQCRGVSVTARVGADRRASKIEVTGSTDRRLVSCVVGAVENTIFIPALLCVTDERVASNWSYELTSTWDLLHHDESVALASAAKKRPK